MPIVPVFLFDNKADNEVEVEVEVEVEEEKEPENAFKHQQL